MKRVKIDEAFKLLNEDFKLSSEDLSKIYGGVGDSGGPDVVKVCGVMCQTCIGCSSSCVVCTTQMADVIPIKPGKPGVYNPVQPIP